jgi:hypothetical protein
MKYLIDEIDLKTIEIIFENNLIDRDENTLEYAEKKINKNEPHTIFIYELLKNDYEKHQENIFYDENVSLFCKGELSSAIVATTTEIVIPCYRIVREAFDPEIEFKEESSRKQDVIKLIIDNTNYRGGIPSIFNDNPDNSVTGFDLSPRWIGDSIKYMVELPMYDRLTIYAYTHNGDVIVNMILRNKSNDEIYDYIKDKSRSNRKYRFFPIFFHFPNS